MNRKRATKYRYFIAIFLSIVLVLGIIFIIALKYIVRDSTPANDTGHVITYSTTKPDEDALDYKFAWKGQPNDPKQVVIESIGAKPYVQKVGVDQNKQVAVPTNINLVGWFVDSARPGEKGLSLIDGHVSGTRNKGVFKDLDKLNAGDKYSVILGNGTELKYKVIGKESVKVAASVGVMFSQNPSVSRQLNLVTCSGNYDPKTRSYDERLIIMSEQIGS